MGEDMPEAPDHAPAPDEALLRGERDQSLWAAFARLPERDQALLRLLTADPAPSYEEIGAALDMPVGSIGPSRARCLERLRREAELPLLAAS
jgi:RNA polymerase sigma factor (sigma-70 family)